MMRHRSGYCTLVLSVLLITMDSSSTNAAAINSVAELSTLYHDVSGTVTVVDADTFRVDDFIYDGGGPAVYFYLATEDTNAAYQTGLRVQPILTGTVYDGTQGPQFFDLPGGETIASYEAISVWCADFKVNFGSGVFVPIPGDLDGDGFVGIGDLNLVLGAWNQDVPPADARADPSGDNYVGIEDLNLVLGNWNTGTPPGGSGLVVPEPGAAGALLLGACAFVGRGRERP